MRYEVVELRGNARLPTLSVGVIAVCWRDGTPYFLLINRKDSMPFCDIVRRRYPITDPLHLQRLVNAMTNQEKQRLMSETHEQLWQDMWGTIRGGLGSECGTAARCFNQLHSSGMLKKALEESTTSWEETEWEFPKGRKSYQERDQMCALREFEEETGVSSSKLQLVSNVVPIEETYTGTNGKAYRHRYYLGGIGDPDVDLSQYQRSEVRKARWLTYEEAMGKIRDYHVEKRRVLEIAMRLVQDLCIMSAEDSRDGRQRQGRTETWGRANWGVRPTGPST
jgi:8-oxo-dGTP pyrophosphatase MutT (NUDIX family)